MSQRGLACAAGLLSSFPHMWHKVNILTSVAHGVCHSDPPSANSFRWDPEMIQSSLFAESLAVLFVHVLVPQLVLHRGNSDTMQVPSRLRADVTATDYAAFVASGGIIQIIYGATEFPGTSSRSSVTNYTLLHSFRPEVTVARPTKGRNSCSGLKAISYTNIYFCTVCACQGPSLLWNTSIKPQCYSSPLLAELWIVSASTEKTIISREIKQTRKNFLLHANVLILPLT